MEFVLVLFCFFLTCVNVSWDIKKVSWDMGPCSQEGPSHTAGYLAFLDPLIQSVEQGPSLQSLHLSRTHLGKDTSPFENRRLRPPSAADPRDFTELGA